VAKYQVPRGTFDILPQESYKWEYIMTTFRNVAKRYQYREIVTPIFETVDLFERSVGDTSDIIQKEMYKFEDKKGRVFALRPEGTAPVVRSYVENNLGVNGGLTKLFYIGPMFRYDRPQAGRFRQFYQYGVEAIGSEHPYVDAEVIALQYNFLSELGLTRFELEVNSVGCADCSKVYNKALKEYFRPYLDELCPDCKVRFEKNPKRILDCKVPACKEISRKAPTQLEYLDEKCLSHFEQVKSYLAEMKIPFVVNPHIVRGLDYYTRTAFEFINRDLGAQNALGGGGRYDKLVEQVGGKDAPGIGFAAGIERLLLSLENEQLPMGEEPKPSYYWIAIGENARKHSILTISELRKAGYSMDFDIEKESLKSQMKAADKSGAKYALIFGDDEVQKGVVVRKDLGSGEQEEISLERLISIKN
jgi:histidyl-tRNA synthetase